MDIFGYSSHVLVNGRKVKEYRHNGLTFIEAKDGTEFAIEVKNHSSSRILAIVSVDGLDIIDGKPATSKSRGYIVNGNDAQTFYGWRKSEIEIGAFKFVHSEKSYATSKGKGQNNGVIAVKLIAEKIEAPTYAARVFPPCVPYDPPAWPKLPTPYYDLGSTGSYSGGGLVRDGSAPLIERNDTIQFGQLERTRSKDLGPSVATTPSFDMGTTWGTKRKDKVVETEFKHGEELATMTFYYASRDTLKALGIPLINERQVTRLPQAFSDSYAQPPKDWNQ